MLIILKATASEAEIRDVNDAIMGQGFTPVPVPGPTRTAVCITGNQGAVDESLFMRLSGVKEVIRVTKSYKLVSREVHEHDTVITIGDVKIGGNNPPVFMAGPCSVETPERTLEVAIAVKAAGAKIFRAGAYKPRTSPYAFQGLGIEGLKILADVRDKTGLKIVTEVVDTESADAVIDYADILQVGTRNMYNYSLLKKLGKAAKPVLLKRGMSATVEEWLNSAEYVMTNGNDRVILCERGIRTFSQHSRNTLDLNVIPLIREQSHLPIVVDPSHGIGKRKFIRDLSRAALACGAHGLLVEAHNDPNTAYSDGAQTVDIQTFSGIVKDAEVLGKLEIQ
jgi:3-deoxy-7-phosphoheptulonate synthase